MPQKDILVDKGANWRRLKVAAGMGPSDQIVEEGFITAHKKALIILAVVVVASVGYVSFNAVEGGVVQTSTVMGKVSAVTSSSTQAAGSGPVPNISRVTVTVGSDTFDQVLACSPAPYRVGQTVLVADQLLGSGQHQYSPDVACRGDVSPYRMIYPAQTTSTTSTHT